MLGNIIIVLAACGFALMGIGAIVKPNVVTQQFGIPQLSVAGRSEVRGVYGGFGLAMAAILVVGLVSPDLRTGITITAAVALLGMAAGRIISALIDRSLPRVALLYLVIEVIMGALLLLARNPAS
jgi:hypothetical protein